MKRAMIALIVLIPATSVVLGIVMLMLALQNPDPQVEIADKPLSKTSWKADP